MARYLTINSKFNPITFEERVKPLLLYKEEYEKQEEALNKMLEDSQSLASLANSPQDSDIYRQYQDYQNSLNGLIDNLTNNGKLDSRAALQLRKQYLQNLKPYESKLARRNELIREQAKNYTPTTMYDIDFSNVGLDSIDDSSSYRTYKLDDIAKTTASTLLSKYTSGESIESEEDEVNSIIKDIDTTNLSNDQINQIKSYIKQGRGAAKQAYNDYLIQQDYKNAQTQYHKALAKKALHDANSSRGSSTGSKSKVPPFIQDEKGNYSRNPEYRVANPSIFDKASAQAINEFVGIGGTQVPIYQDVSGNFAIQKGQSIVRIPELSSNAINRALGIKIPQGLSSEISVGVPLRDYKFDVDGSSEVIYSASDLDENEKVRLFDSMDSSITTGETIESLFDKGLIVYKKQKSTKEGGKGKTATALQYKFEDYYNRE